MNFTPAQRLAIDTKDRTLLISAAAGSGKTRTLTERIISSLIDREHPADLSRMLIVTFTRAAASELKERIEKAVSDALKNDPDNQHLARQLVLLPGAHISTIDSFCNFIVRQNAGILGISPAFRIPDEAERSLLMHTVMDELIDSLYANEIPSVLAPRFMTLAAELASARAEDSLSDVLLSLYESLQGQEDPVGVLRENARLYREECAMPIFETRAGKFISEMTVSAAEHYRLGIQRLHGEIRAEDGFWGAEYAGFTEQFAAALQKIEDAARVGYAQAQAALAERAFPSAPRNKKDIPKGDAALRMDAFCKECREEIRGLFARYYAYSEQMWRETLPSLAERMETLAETIAVFAERFSAEKRRRMLCDFGDLSHLTYSLFCKDGKPTDAARAVAARFDAIYVDEYQDINAVQHKIFECIATPTNRFMVGDIKQSIYSFRHAQPDIFARMRREFSPIEEKGETASLFMSDNFRCDKPVIDFVNSVFCPLFSLAGQSIGYEDADKLAFSKIYDKGITPREFPVKVGLFFSKEMPKDAPGDGDADEESADLLDESLPPEALWVAKEIRRLLDEGEVRQDGKRITPSDIAILLRTGKNKTKRFSAALRALGVTVAAEEETEFFMTPEVLLALSILNSIDNPHRDIYLTGLMRSPLFSFSFEELMAIRREGDPDRTRSLYDTLLAYTALHPEEEKPKKVLSFLDKWRARAEGMSVDRLLRELYAGTGLLSMRRDEKDLRRRSNLLLLYNYARRFEAGGYKGLYSFIAYINEIIASGKRFDDVKSTESEKSSVRIFTMHKSKGLEFPVCFVCDLGAPFNHPHNKLNLVYSHTLGAAMRMNDGSGLIPIENPWRNAVIDSIDLSQAEEEMRVLYVALTRARERLYVTGSPRKREDSFFPEAELLVKTFSRYSILAARNAMQWILAATENLPGGQPPFICTEEEEGGEKPAETTEQTAAADPRLTELFRERFAYRYPYEHMTNIPRKLSVSRLHPSVLDEEEEPVAELSAEEKPQVATVPAFLGGDKTDEAAKRGTATHLFLQFCDFRSLLEKGAEAELIRLREEGFLTAEDAKRVRLDEIELFCRSSLPADILSASEVYREARFHVALPAEEFAREPARRESLRGEKILVQGVIDCVFRRADGALVLLDYKTDRLTKEQLRDKLLAKELLESRHGEQLAYYRAACRSLFGQLPDETLIYSLPLGDSIKL